MQTIPTKTLHNIQQIISKFVWQEKKPRIRMGTLNKNIRDGGIAMPNLVNYYYAARLVNNKYCMPQRQKIYWGADQLGILLPLSEWALLVHRPLIGLHYKNNIRYVIMGGLLEVPEAVNSRSIHDHIGIKSPSFPNCQESL